MSVDQPVGQTVGPQAPASAALRHTNPGEDALHPRSPSGNSADNVGVKEERLYDLGLLGGKQPCQAQ